MKTYKAARVTGDKDTLYFVNKYCDKLERERAEERERLRKEEAERREREERAKAQEESSKETTQPENLEEFVLVPPEAFTGEPRLVEAYKHPSYNINLEKGLHVSRRKLPSGGISWSKAKKIIEEDFQGRLLTPALYFKVLQWAETNDKDLAEDLESGYDWLDGETESQLIIGSGLNNEVIITIRKNLYKLNLTKRCGFDYKDIDPLIGIPSKYFDLNGLPFRKYKSNDIDKISIRFLCDFECKRQGAILRGEKATLILHADKSSIASDSARLVYPIK